MSKAYLVMGMRHVGTPYPVVVSVGIYSSNAMNLSFNVSLGDFYVDVMSTSPYESYQEAKDALLKYIFEADWLIWARPWVDESKEAHAAKFYWRILPSRRGH